MSATLRARQVADYMRQYLDDNDNMPTALQVAEKFGFASKNAAYENFKSLERHKILERTPKNASKWRFVRVVNK